jgi:polysaccharide biosynthesis transport protein
MELRDYIHVFSARRWVIIQAALIVTLTAVAVSYVQPRTYQGQAQVIISEGSAASALLGNSLSPLSSQPERSLQTQIELMRSRPTAEATIKKLGLNTTPQDLLKHVTVTEAGQTNIVNVTATDASPEMAVKIANTMAEEYVVAARDAQRASITAAADEVERRLEDAQTQIIAIGHRIASSKNESADLTAELQIATGTYSTLAEKLESLRISEQLETGPGRITSPAVSDPRPVSPKPLRNGVLGLIIGIVFGISMAFLYEYLDNTIKSTEEAEKLFGAPVLGTIPADKLEKGQKRRLALVESPGSSTAESYRVLRNSLDFVNFQKDIHTLLITSAAPGEGKSTVAANLSAALAQAGKKVVLVSVDFRRPTTDQFFNVNNMIGLSDVLLGTHSLKSALQRPGEEQLLVLTAGKMPPNPSELLSSHKMQEVLHALGEWGEWIIIDSPPLLAVADPASVARWSDGVLMVSQAGVSTREAGAKAMQLLEKVGARTVGVVIWGLDESRAGTAGYGYYAGGYYYYASYYSPSPEPKKKKRAKEGAPPAPVPEKTWVPEISPGRRFAAALGRVLSGVLAFLVVVAIAAVVAFFLDRYFGWGLSETVTGYMNSFF